MDWSTVPVEGEQMQAANKYLAERQAAQTAAESEKLTSKSVLSPEYRPRGILGGQEVGGLAGGITGLIAGAPAGPAASIGLGILGAGAGGAFGEGVEQFIRGEPMSGNRLAQAGFEEAVWDAAGNLVLKGAAKTIRFGADKLGFTKKDIPDANQAANDFLTKYGSSLPLAARTGSNLDDAIEGFVYTPATFDIFKKKQQEISDALQTGQKDIILSFSKSPEFEQALRNGSSAQKSSGEVLQNFIKQGEQSLSESVDPIYKGIFASVPKTNLIETTTGGAPQVTMFSVKNWANKELQNPAALTAGQRSILNEMKNLPPSVDFFTLHKMRSRWLAENRDKYASMGSEKDSKAVETISGVIKEFDAALDTSARTTLPPDLLKQYRTVTKTYREGIQGLQTDSIQQAMKLYPEEVGAFLFASGKETPIAQLYKSVAAAGTLSKKSSKEVLDSLRIGYLDALTRTPENMLKFANEVEQNQATQNTFRALFEGTPQYKAILAMNEAAKKGLVSVERQPGLNLRTGAAVANIGAPVLAVGSGYAFLLSPEQQQKIKDNLVEASIAGGGLILSQRKLAKIMADPKGAKAITYLAQAKDKLGSPTAFTKLVVEPLANFFGPSNESGDTGMFGQSMGLDWSTVPVK
jgi:hypothetical protein